MKPFKCWIIGVEGPSLGQATPSFICRTFKIRWMLLLNPRTLLKGGNYALVMWLESPELRGIFAHLWRVDEQEKDGIPLTT